MHMDLLTISWVRNESDIIEEFVRHHCKIAERMIIIDNDSKDNSLKILQALLEEGLPLTIETDHSRIHAQDTAVNAALRSCIPHFRPAWVLPLDADEFLVSTTGEDVRNALERTPTNRVSLLPWRTYIPLPDQRETEKSILRRITHRRSIEQPAYTKVLLPSDILASAPASAAVGFGNHDFTGDDVPHELHPSLALAHFPVRSARQIAVKAIGGWLRYSANPHKRPDWIYQWKTVYDELARGGALTQERLTTLARAYAQTDLPPDVDAEPLVFDPLPDPPSLRFTPRPLDPQEFLFDTAEEMADFCCDVQRATPTPDVE